MNYIHCHPVHLRTRPQIRWGLLFDPWNYVEAKASDLLAELDHHLLTAEPEFSSPLTVLKLGCWMDAGLVGDKAAGSMEDNTDRSKEEEWACVWEFV